MEPLNFATQPPHLYPAYKSTILQGVWKGHAVSNTLTIDLP